MGSESCFATKEQMDEQIFRSPWAEYPLPPLHKACRDGDVQSLLYLVIQGDRLEVFRSVNEQDHFLMWTPAHWAAYFGQLECLMRLVSCGLSLDVTDGRLKQTAVHLAAFSGNALVLDWVLQAGATADKTDSLGETAVHKAVRGGSTECLNILHSHGATMDVVNSSLQRPTDIARSLRMNQCLEFLKALNGFICRPLKRSLDDDDMEDHVKKSRNDSHNMAINVNVSSLITNNTSYLAHQQKLLTMMEANGQYPLVTNNHSTMDYANGDMQVHSHVLNGNMQHTHAMSNGNMLHSSAINGDTYMHMDNLASHQAMIEQSLLNQAPQKCMMLCGHLQ